MSGGGVELRDAVVLVTGSSSGIGRATALAFDRAGARVALAARRAERLEESATSMRDALVVQTDLGDATQAIAMVERTVAHFGGLDVLVNNAGTAVLARSDVLEAPDLERVLASNFVGHAVATGRAAQHMRRAGRGHVVNVTSPAAWMGSPLLAGYAASKAALSGWTRTLQGEWAGTGIFVSEYVPGLFATEIGTGAADASGLGVGHVDVLSSPIRHRIARPWSRPRPPEEAGAQIVDLVRRPRPIRYSSPSIRLITWACRFPRIRRALGDEMARALREQLALSVFSEPEQGPGSLDSPTSGTR
jgi:NAD(P)-dependent dehydrogenase (short-subunit alcohol dehydrogenase family)